MAVLCDACKTVGKKKQSSWKISLYSGEELCPKTMISLIHSQPVKQTHCQSRATPIHMIEYNGFANSCCSFN